MSTTRSGPPRPPQAGPGATRPAPPGVGGPPRAATGSAATGPAVRCPVCRQSIPWDTDPARVYEPDARTGNMAERDLSGLDRDVRSLRRSTAFVPCPRSTDPLVPHYVPANYLDHGAPLVVGLVGRPRASKTHLLIAMLDALGAGGAAYGITRVTALDARAYRVFRTEAARFLAGGVLDSTVHDVQRYAASVQFRTPGGPMSLVFFDISGEDFEQGVDRTSADFLLGADGVLLVEDIGDVLSTGNESVTGALATLEHHHAGHEVPAAIVLAKADRERYTDPIDRWLRAGPVEGDWAEAFHRESRDVYAWLHSRGATNLLATVQAFPRCTLHVASASGSAATGASFLRGVRPMRVLEPLIALLAMTGRLSGPGAERVGR